MCELLTDMLRCRLRDTTFNLSSYLLTTYGSLRFPFESEETDRNTIRVIKVGYTIDVFYLI